MYQNWRILQASLRQLPRLPETSAIFQSNEDTRVSDYTYYSSFTSHGTIMSRAVIQGSESSEHNRSIIGTIGKGRVLGNAKGIIGKKKHRPTH